MITFSDNIARKPYLGSTEIAEVWLGNVLIYPEDTVDYSTQYLTFEAIDNGTTFQFNQDGLEYSLNDGSTWDSLGASVDTPSLNTGGKIMFRGNLTITQDYGIGQFSSNGHFNIEGNPLSLVDDTNFANITDLTVMNQIFFQLFYGTDVVDASNLALPATILSQDCYTSMFQGCTSLTTAPELPATTLAEYCYQSMFEGCTSLVNAPQLPVTTLAYGCYASMFKGCTSLTTAPVLPAIMLAQGCYNGMFNGCTKLVNAPALTATTLAAGCYGGMFNGCRSLTTAPALPATTLKNNCYQQMFSGCTSLTTAPSLPATTLANKCYSNMFKGCTSLTTAPELPATTLAGYCYQSMFQGCTKLTTAPELSSTTLVSYCYDTMFYGCTSLTTAPELPATTLANYCYNSMFQGCTSLNYIKAMFTTKPSTSYTSNWVSGVSATGTFVKNSAATWNVTGVNGVPTGWTVQRDYPKIYKKYRATYSNSTTVDGDCDGNNLVIDEVTKSGLKTVVIGECVPAIVGECFADCANLTSVIIEGNTSIDHYSFARNNGHLTSITMYSITPPPCQPTAFTYYNGGSYVPMTSIKIYVPSQSVNAYKAASGWSRYSTKIQAIPT